MTTALQLDFLEARPVVCFEPERIELHLVGCGGTGSWLAPTIARVARTLNDRGVDVHLTFQDPDTVEEVNVPRQNFCYAEIGANKAETLAARYSAAWGLEISAESHGYIANRQVQTEQRLKILIGCVDNAAARQELHQSLGKRSYEGAPAVWWLDCGNWRESGQVLLGCAKDRRSMGRAFELVGACTALPSPALQCPELLVAQPEETAPRRQSCAELAARDEQSLVVNQVVAAIAGDFLLRLLASRDLKRFATYFDLPSGTSRSLYTTPAAVGRVGTKKQRRT